jgi:BirA family transcriptional regulator, biotin operon repressor / biotin---[acetyl-CoA-carboxylase] ligase
MSEFTIHRVESIDSTNTRLLQWSTQFNCHRVALVADVQTAGRGQRGRQWHAALGDALLCSVAWQFPRQCALVGLSLAVGVMVAEALDGGAGSDQRHRLRLKWPNDLLIDDTHKLGGILIETVASPSATRTAVIGIGINLRTPVVASADMPVRALPSVGLDAWWNNLEQRDVTLERVISALDVGLERFACRGFSAFQASWWARRAYANQAVVARLPDGRVISGLVQAVTERGALVIESERGLHTLVSGEVSLRVASA